MIGTLKENIQDVRRCVRRASYTEAERVLDEILDEFQDDIIEPLITRVNKAVLNKLLKVLALNDFSSAHTLAEVYSLLPED